MTRLTRNLIFALVASVVVNVFFAGLLAGRFMRGAGRRPSPDTIETEAAPMRGVWRSRDAVLRPRSEAVNAARRAARDALVAEPFDPQAMESALAGLRTQTDAAQIVLHRALVDAARELSPEDRRRLADSRWFYGGGARRHQSPRVP